MWVPTRLLRACFVGRLEKRQQVGVWVLLFAQVVVIEEELAHGGFPSRAGRGDLGAFDFLGLRIVEGVEGGFGIGGTARPPSHFYQLFVHGVASDVVGCLVWRDGLAVVAYVADV